MTTQIKPGDLVRVLDYPSTHSPEYMALYPIDSVHKVIDIQVELGEYRVALAETAGCADRYIRGIWLYPWNLEIVFSV